MTDTLEEKVQTIDTQSDTSVETTAQNITADAKVDDTPAQSVTSLDIDGRAEKVVQFLQKFYRGSHGYSYFWLKNKSTDDSETLAFNIEVPEEILTQAKKALELNENDFYDAYFGVNVGNTPCSSNTRYKKDEIIEQVAIVADVDIRNPKHHKGDTAFYPPNIATACVFLPVMPTFFINSGGGCHGYWKFETPFKITSADDINSATIRGKNFLDVMRRRAGNFSKSIDGVHDLPRILRLPYSLNCKERDNRKMCFIINESDNLFTTAQIDDIIESSKPVKSEVDATPSDKPKYQSNGILPNSDNPPEYESARIIEMLNTIPPSSLSDNEWLAIQSACKNLNVLFSIVDDWNRQDAERYDERENQTRYDSLKDSSFGIETLAGIAKRFGYVESDFKRQWYQDNPQFDTRLHKAQEYSERAGRNFVPLVFFATVEKQIADAELIAENFIANIDDFSTEKIFSYEVLYSAAIVKNHCEVIGTFEKFYQACKSAKLNMSHLKSYLKKYESEVQAFIGKIQRLKFQAHADYNAAKNSVADDELFNYPVGYDVTDEDGISHFGSQIAYSPMRITALYNREFDGNQTVDIWTRDISGKAHVIKNVDKNIIADSRKIVSLASKGLDVNYGNAKDLVKYFSEYINANKKFLKPKKLLNKLGWYGDDTKFFVTPYDSRYSLDDDRLSDFAKALKQRGSFEKWKEFAAEVMKYPVARFTLFAAFATPLLKIFNERNFSIYMWCCSKAGKSAVQKFAASVWGSQDVIRNCNTTLNGLEGELAESTDFPAIYDERQLARNLNLSDVAYLIGQGKGRGRMTKDGKPKPRYSWRGNGILGGEEPLNADAKTQGMWTRLIQLNIQSEKIIPDDLAERIYTESLDHHYGYGGLCFVNNLLKEDFAELREMRRCIISKLKESKKILIADYYRYISTIVVADYLAQKYLFGTDENVAMGNALNNAAEIIKLIESEKELSDVSREWDYISAWIASNRGQILNNPNLSFKNSDGITLPPTQNKIIGTYVDGQLFIIVARFNDACQWAKFNPKKVKNDLFKAGYIVPTDGEITPSKWIEAEVGKCRVMQINFSGQD